MSLRSYTLTVIILTVFLTAMTASAAERADHSDAAESEAKILQSWHGDYPLDKLSHLPDGQREHGIGYIDNAKTFFHVWKAFRSDETVPEIDFRAEAVPKIDFRSELVIFVRNIHFYNSVRIGRVIVKNGVAEVMAMETMTAIPIKDSAAMSLVVVSRQGITGIQNGDKITPVSQ